MYISLHDLGLIILFIVALCAGIYFIVTLKNLNDLLKSGRDFFKHHQENMDKSFKLLPETLKNTSEMTQSIRHQVDEVGSSLSNLGSGLSETVATINDKADTGITLIKGVGEIFKILVDIFSKSKD
ncbi:hypothetical protein [Candidatus Formimonas warabiya]|uniref:DUF948 domain-containing protein n=1 Tax=Formimonas warabiya TaxID=1761012 RepID=A0A3G1KYG9_FORW1|nr:hypothetical protein [Candidatus Formimonas warabiya]ATW27491.1 hypothetical protein DCMF_24500 [Candidatus Formimonas warabiya]